MNKFGSIFLALLIAGCMGFPQQDYDYEYSENPSDGYDFGEEEIEPEEPLIVEEPPVFQDESRTITVREGEDVVLSCKIVKPTQHILIFKKVPPIRTKTDILIYVGEMKLDQKSRFNASQNVFKLSNVSRLDAGEYHCQYQAFPGNDVKYVLDVEFPPSVKAKSPRKQRVNKGDSVTMECEAKGNPEPVITWSKEMGKLPSGLAAEPGYSMTLENVDRHVEGTYICSAENGLGNPVSASMKLMVEYPPEITTEKAIIRTGEGDKVELVCIVHSRPIAEVSWTKDGLPLTPEPQVTEFEGGHRHAITITQVTEHNFGTYQCDAVNEKGETSATISLTDIPKQPQFTSPATSAEETSYTLAWDTESYYPITKYNVKYRLAKANDSTDLPGNWTEQTVEVPEDNIVSDGLIHEMKHTINELLPATDYQAIVSVMNKFKWGEEGKFNFSTRKASPTTTTIATTLITTTPPPLAEENVQNPHEETVSWHKTSGAAIQVLNIGMLLSALVFAYLS